LDLEELPFNINGLVTVMPIHMIKKIYKKPYTGSASPQKKIKIQSLSSPYQMKNGPQMIHHIKRYLMTHMSSYIFHLTPKPTIPPELNKEPRIETLAVRILFIHHKNTTLNIPNLKSKLLQSTNKIQINPSYIATPPPTPNNTKVHKHPKWNKLSYPSQLNPSNTLPLPDFPRIYQSKFQPQYCYYTNGSFTPPNNKPMVSGTQHKLDMAFGTHYIK
jgi:hypothetical protein